MWTNSIILSLIFVSVTCDRYDTLKLSEPTSPPVTHTHMSQLLELCYSNVSNPIAMSPNLINAVYHNPSNTLTAPIIVLDDNFLAKDIQLYYPAYPTYVLSVDTYRQLLNLIKKIWKTQLWNTASVFYVIGNTDQSCRNALQMTYVLWLFDCLSSFVICQGMNNQTMLYTLNPFTHRAPYPWIEVEEIDVPDPRLAIYEQPFINDEILCDALNFDKTQFLDGYNVKITDAGLDDQFLQEYVFSSLNMTPIITYADGANKYLLGKRFQDVSETLFFLDSTDNKFVDIVPAVIESNYAIVTQKRSFLSLLNQAISVFNVNDIIALIIILILFIIVIILSNEYQIIPAFMDVFKLLLRMGMDSPLDRLFMKINLFTALLFIFMFGPSIDAQLFAILTRPSSFNVETLQDLHDHRYHVYYHSSLQGDMLREEIWTTVEDMKYLHPGIDVLPQSCLKLASEDNTVACIYNTPYVLPNLKKNLRVSKNFVFKTSYTYWTRKDWPLKKRVDQQTLRAIESGFVDKRMNRPIRNTLKKIEDKERLKKILDFNEVDAIDLEYAYIFFAFIQFLAIIIFGIEHIIARCLRSRQ